MWGGRGGWGQWAEALKWRPGPGKELNGIGVYPHPHARLRACLPSVFEVIEPPRSGRLLEEPQFTQLATQGLSDYEGPLCQQLLAMPNRAAGERLWSRMRSLEPACLPRFEAPI